MYKENDSKPRTAPYTTQIAARMGYISYTHTIFALPFPAPADTDERAEISRATDDEQTGQMGEGDDSKKGLGIRQGAELRR